MKKYIKLTILIAWKVFLLLLVLILSIIHFFYRRLISKDHIWLIGENRGDCVCDNGYFFYKYCRTIHPDRKVYFLVDVNSVVFKEFSPKDRNVIAYGSIRNALLFSLSDICLYTHTYSDIIYRRIYELFGVNKKLVFLHHGVLGFKKFNDFYKKNCNIMDVFTVGSKLEKQILEKQVGVFAYKLRLTGYARYDYLKNKATPKDLKIIYIPTFRDWILDDFCFSNFYDKVNSFLNNDKLGIVLDKYHVKLNVYLHKYMQPFAGSLSSKLSGVKFLVLGETSPLHLISECHLMITDYSSPSWDFFFLGKPVIFYRFDIEEYLKVRDSYIPLDRENIGEIVYDEDKLIEKVEEYCIGKFSLKPCFEQYREIIYPGFDGNNCSRIYDEIIKIDE